jgi:hypothetical protein
LVAALVAVLLAVLATYFATGLIRLFGSALRAVAGTAVLARAGEDGFDFATIFLDFATALAMTDNNPIKGEKMGALHHFEGFRASSRTPSLRNQGLPRYM